MLFYKDICQRCYWTSVLKILCESIVPKITIYADQTRNKCNQNVQTPSSESSVIFARSIGALILCLVYNLEEGSRNTSEHPLLSSLDQLDHNLPSKSVKFFSSDLKTKYTTRFVWILSIIWCKFPVDATNLKNPICLEKRIVLLQGRMHLDKQVHNHLP